MSHFYVAKNGVQEGPYSLEEISQKIAEGLLSSVDHVYDPEKTDWCSLSEFSLTQAFFNLKNAESKDGDDKAKSESAAATWFILKSENKYGPFSKNDLIKMLQEKSLYEHDYVWHNGMGSWKRIAEVTEFSPEEVRKFMDEVENDKMSEIFFRRRHARANYGASIIVHNNKKVWTGKSIEISSGGAGIEIETDLLLTGESIYLHFKPGAGVPPFNAMVEVVNKHALEKDKDGKVFVRYGLKFTKIHFNIQKAIKDYTEAKQVSEENNNIGKKTA